jgi:hypothetical protein
MNYAYKFWLARLGNGAMAVIVGAILVGAVMAVMGAVLTSLIR